MASNEALFYHTGTSTEEDAESVFGPLEPDEKMIALDMDDLLLAHLMHHAGVFPSIKQAKNNGWNKPIPRGYSEFRVGKKRFGVFIWYPSTPPTTEDE
jgi:hypothetical protein